MFARGSAEATKQAHVLIATMIRDPDVDIMQMLPRTSKPVVLVATPSVWDKSHTLSVSYLLTFVFANPCQLG